MSKDWKDIDDDEILNYRGNQTPQIEYYNRIMQKKNIDAVNSLKDKVTGLMETIYRASQGMQEKYDSYSRSQTKQQNIIIALTVVIAVSTAVYTWTTWQSVSAMRDANEIQKQMLSAELKRQSESKTHNKRIRQTPKSGATDG